jgi:hypothetical protein
MSAVPPQCRSFHIIPESVNLPAVPFRLSRLPLFSLQVQPLSRQQSPNSDTNLLIGRSLTNENQHSVPHDRHDQTHHLCKLPKGDVLTKESRAWGRATALCVLREETSWSSRSRSPRPDSPFPPARTSSRAGARARRRRSLGCLEARMGWPLVRGFEFALGDPSVLEYCKVSNLGLEIFLLLSVSSPGKHDSSSWTGTSHSHLPELRRVHQLLCQISQGH